MTTDYATIQVELSPLDRRAIANLKATVEFRRNTLILQFFTLGVAIGAAILAVVVR